MNNKLTKKTITLFESIKRHDANGIECWSGRELGLALGYAEYRNFIPVIEKAIEACKNSQHPVNEHFVELHEMIAVGNGAEREIVTIMMTRYACYLAVQNSNPSKPIVAQAQTYFATQTRIAEIEQSKSNGLTDEESKRLFLRNEMTVHNTRLASAASDAGVKEPRDYAIFQNHGYKGLYGGLGAKEIHERKGLKKSQQILDHMGSTELAANLFRATQTEEKLRRENIHGKSAANRTHFEVGAKVRKTIEELGGTMPEDLPTPESIKKLESKQKRIESEKSKGDS